MDCRNEHDDRPFPLTPDVMSRMNERVDMDAVHAGVTLNMQSAVILSSFIFFVN